VGLKKKNKDHRLNVAGSKEFRGVCWSGSRGCRRTAGRRVVFLGGAKEKEKVTVGGDYIAFPFKQEENLIFREQK